MTTANSRVADLAQGFEQINRDWLSLVEPMTEDQWRTPVANEQRSIAVMTYHIAASHSAVAGWLQGMVAGQGLPPVTPAMLNHHNAHQASEVANCHHAATIALLRQTSATVADAIRGLSEAQLNTTASLVMLGGQTVSAADVIEFILIGHAQSHLASVRAAVDEPVALLA